MSIYSRVHLGEPKLIETHHNGLFISRADGQRPLHLVLYPLPPFLLRAWYEKRRWIRLVEGHGRLFDYCGDGVWERGAQGHFCAAKMESESSLLGTTRVHAHTYSMYRNIWARIITSLALFSSCQNCLSFVSLSFLTSSGAPSSLPLTHSLFSPLLDIFKSSSSACDSFFQLPCHLLLPSAPRRGPQL